MRVSESLGRSSLKNSFLFLSKVSIVALCIMVWLLELSLKFFTVFHFHRVACKNILEGLVTLEVIFSLTSTFIPTTALNKGPSIEAQGALR